MMKRWLAGEIDKAGVAWRERYETLKTAEQIAAYQARLKAFFVEVVGGWPERTPLNARVTGEVKRPGFTVRKVIFESQPGHFVSNLLFVPDAVKYPGRRPGVLLVCGHADEGKANDKYQRAAALLALNGVVCLMMDPIEQGERYQMVDAAGKPKYRGNTLNHTMSGVGSILLGRNTARFEIWDGMRAIDYLQSLDFVDGSKIGCLGNSGGGTQTAYLMALDERIVAASPSCYITRMDILIDERGPQDAEQNIHGQLAYGMWHSDYLLMRAPKPTLMCVATHDYFDIEGAWSVYRDAKRLFGRMGYAERVDLAEHDAPHGYNQPLREAAARWMVRWLSGDDRVIFEPEIEVLSIEEANCTPGGRVMSLPGARSVYDLNRDEETRLSAQRATAWQGGATKTLLNKVRKVAGVRRLNDLPMPVTDEIGRDDVGGTVVEKVVMRVEDGVFLPLVVVKPKVASTGVVLITPGEGFRQIGDSRV
ncbi:MAG: alpha/beta hydrolase family protein, partial [Planctomycetota bacterium]